MILSLFTLTACGCEHEWSEATCTEPQVCSLCEETQGEPLGHAWVDATCEDPKMCSVCSATEGDALGHVPENWKTTGVNYVTATVSSKKYCSVCAEAVDSQKVTLKSLHDDEKLLISPNDFVTRLSNKLNNLSGNDIEAFGGTIDDDFACGLMCDGEKIGVLMFADGEDSVTNSEKNSSCIKSILGTAGPSDNYTKVWLALIETCDPSLTFEECKDIAKETLLSEVTRNGLIYSFIPADDGAILCVSVDD